MGAAGREGELMVTPLVEADLREAKGGLGTSTWTDGLSPRTRRLKETVLHEAATFTERAIWLAESFRQTEPEPSRPIRVAKAVAHLLANMPVAIRDGEILAGWHPNTHEDEASAPVIMAALMIFGMFR